MLWVFPVFTTGKYKSGKKKKKKLAQLVVPNAMSGMQERLWGRGWFIQEKKVSSFLENLAHAVRWVSGYYSWFLAARSSGVSNKPELV